MATGRYCAGRLCGVGPHIVGLDEEMQDRPVVPVRVRALREVRAGHIARDLGDGTGEVAQPLPRNVQRRIGQVQHSYRR